jgi:D-glycero-D-manno-heptose 1,7-bisphosphate phosphatase
MSKELSVMNKKSKRAVFLDRDGVINRSIVRGGKPYPPSSLEEVEILPGVSNALRELKEADLLLICVTNQPDIARGTQNRKTVEAIHKHLLDSLCLDEILVCYHDDKDKCKCRKPFPGMLLDAAMRFSIDLEQSFMIGDRWRDIEAGQRAGCRTILIDYGYEERGPLRPPDMKVGLLSEAADLILQKIGKG